MNVTNITAEEELGFIEWRANWNQGRGNAPLPEIPQFAEERLSEMVSSWMRIGKDNAEAAKLAKWSEALQDPAKAAAIDAIVDSKA